MHDLERSSEETVMEWNGSTKTLKALHCVKSGHIRSYSGPHFPAFVQNTEKCYSVRMRENTDLNNSEYGHFLRSAKTADTTKTILRCLLVETETGSKK